MRLIDADALIEFCAERWIPLNIDAVNMQPTIQTEEAIPVSWITAQIKRLKGMDNLFADLTADIIQTTLNEWRKEQEGETT